MSFLHFVDVWLRALLLCNEDLAYTVHSNIECDQGPTKTEKKYENT